MNKLQGTIFVIIAAVLYGIMPIWVKLAYQTGLTAFEVIFLRSAMAAVILGLFILFRRIKFRIERKQIGPLFLCTVLGYTATTVTLYSSYNYISSGMATSLLYLYPVLVMLFSFFVLHEKMPFMKWIALAASLAGIYLIAEPGGSSFSFLGMVLGTGAAVFCALYTLSLNHPQLKRMDSFVLAFYSCLVESISSLTVVTAQGKWPMTVTLEGYTYTGLVGIFCTVLALIFFIRGAQSIGSANASIVCTLEPVVSLLGGIMILHERLTWYTSLGCFLIVVAVFFIGYSDLREHSNSWKESKRIPKGSS